MKKITIDPITRLEGHGKIAIFLNDEGDVANAYLQIPELRGFEKFCEGRRVEEMPNLTSRICGVCPEAHSMSSTKALDAVFHIEPSSAVKKIRELLYSAFHFADKTTHFYILAGADFVVGPEAPPAERNILGLIAKVGKEAGLSVIRHRLMGHKIIQIIGGRQVHATYGLPGGVSKPLTKEEIAEIQKMAKEMVKFGEFTLKLFNDIVLKNKAYVDLILSDTYTSETYYMGTVDKNNHVNFYDGKIRVVGPDGKEFVKYDPKDYQKHLAERVEPWTYLKFPYLKNVGWKGLVGGKNSGVYQATPLSRLNAADGMATLLAQEAYKTMYETLGGKPVHKTLATHWARIIELMYAAERTLELSEDPEIAETDVRPVPKEKPTKGVGEVEAPRGTLTHDYETDERGVVKKVNLIVGTTNNNAAISISVKKAAQGVIKKGKVSEGLLNKVEMAFRSYDPCMACATHTLPGQMPLEVKIYDSQMNPIKTLRR